jgi:putative flippase GtrA
VTETARILRFLAAGGASAVANAVSRAVFSRVVSYEVAVALAYLVGMTVAFVLMRRFVFEPARDSARSQYARFALVNAWGFLQVWLISVALARLVFPAIAFHWHADTIAHLIGLGSLAVTSYAGHKRFSFRATARNAPEGHAAAPVGTPPRG